MTSKRTQRNLGGKPLKKSARLLNPQGALVFDNAPESVVLSPEEKASFFLSEYNELVDPFTRFPHYWRTSALDPDVILAGVRNGYKRYVLGSFEWTEDKFVAVINEIFERDMEFTQFSFNAISRLYDREELDSQNAQSGRRARDLDRRRRDI